MSTIANMAKALVPMLGFMVLTGCHSIFPPALTPTSNMVIQTAHKDWYVIAQDQNDNWSLRQRAVLDECGRFTVYDIDKDGQGNRTIALKTCHNRFVTVPRGDVTRTNQPVETRRDRMAWQEERPGDCAQFTLVEQGDGTVAFRTCGGKYLTAGNAGEGWGPPVEWAIVVENDKAEAWEKLKLSPPP